MAAGIADLVAVEEVSTGEYVSKHFPIQMGNPSRIAYGGFTSGVAVSAACSTVPANLSLYSVLGHFHGPASTDMKLHCTVTNTRDTRSFATRRVQVKQQQPDGKFRVCQELIADFHVQEPSVLDYSAPPADAWPRPEDCPTAEVLAASLRDTGRVSQAEYDSYVTSFGIQGTYFESRFCPNGAGAQNLGGTAKNVTTTQDHRPITSKTCAEWISAVQRPTTVIGNLSALAFLMDGGLSFLPLTHNHQWFDEVGACSTLDFAFRVFTPAVDLGDWHLRERSTSRGGNGRTFSEGKLWDEKGNLVASMSQQSILRVAKAPSKL